MRNVDDEDPDELLRRAYEPLSWRRFGGVG
jgi:hypothetical protein